jgi:iron complex outermembrane receptor protein
MRSRIAIALLGSVIALSLIPTAATAEIETIVVTAERRAENVQEIPVAITAIEGDTLDATGTTGFKELQNIVPSLRFGAGVTGGENVITMRGLGSQNTTPGGDSPVAYSVDGVPLQRTTAVDPEFYDVDRIEVLRGPQGTLYGRNSVGGSINVISNRPVDTLSGSVDGLLGDYDQRTARGWISGPLWESGDMQVLGRLTGVYAEHDNYTKNSSTSPGASDDLNGQDFHSVRGQLLFSFNPDLSLLLAAGVTQDHSIASPNTAWWEVPARYTGGTNPIPAGSNCDFGTEASYRARTVCHEVDEKASNKLVLYSATLDWNLEWATVTSVSGYSTNDVSQNSDGDGSEQPMAFGDPWIMRQKQYSQELRLASNDNSGPLNWIVGAFYFQSDNYEDFGYSDTGYNDVFAGPAPGFPGSLDTFNFLSHGHTKTKSYAAFGQVDYDLAKTSLDIPLTVTLGLRYSNDKKYGFNYLDYQLPYLCGGSCGVFKGPFSSTWSEPTGKFGLAYQATDNLMLYTSASKGYLAGGNIIGLATVYDPETMWSYEVGLKSTFWDSKAQLNVAAYHEDIKKLQVFIQNGTLSGINNVNGETNVDGLETEFVLAPIENLRFNATVTVTNAEYGKYVTTDARFGPPPPGCNLDASGNPVVGGTLCNFKGNNLSQTPPYSVSVGLQYTFNTYFGPITPRVDSYFSGRVDFLPDNFQGQDSYTQTNIHVTWTSLSGHYKLDWFVNNLEDKDVISNDGLQSITLGQQQLEPDNFIYYPPRIFGVRLAYSFGGS